MLNKRTEFDESDVRTMLLAFELACAQLPGIARESVAETLITLIRQQGGLDVTTLVTRAVTTLSRDYNILKSL